MIARAVFLLELADDIQIRQCRNRVLRGAPGHAVTSVSAGTLLACSLSIRYATYRRR